MRMTFDGATKDEVEQSARSFKLEYEYETEQGKATENPDGTWTLEMEVKKPTGEELMF
ncbi:MAG: hypothetical protein RR272_03255 [Synergistaceae bacterium]